MGFRLSIKRTILFSFLILLMNCGFQLIKAVMWFRIRIHLGPWIRARIPNPDPDPGVKRREKQSLTNIFFRRKLCISSLNLKK